MIMVTEPYYCTVTKVYKFIEISGGFVQVWIL
jgi:hypothetical protein